MRMLNKRLPLVRAAGNAAFATLMALGAVSMTAAAVYGVVNQRSVTQTNESSGHILARAATILASETSSALDGYPLPLAGSTAMSDGYVVPATSAAPKADAKNVALLYCPWDNGTANTSTGRLTGDTPGSDTSIVFALVASGPNRRLETSCVNAKAGLSAGDDIVKRMTVSELRSAGSMKYYLAPVDCENAATPTSDLAGNTVDCSNSRSRLDLVPTSSISDGSLITIRKSGKVFQWVTAAGQWRQASGSGGGYSAPDDFNFTPVTGANTSTLTVSNSVTLTNVSPGAPISIDGAGQYQINGGAWSSVIGSVKPGDTLAVRVTSSSSPETTVSTIVNVAGKAKTFSVTTASVAIEDVFSAVTYIGSGGNQLLNTGVNLASRGGMIWTTGRQTSEYYMHQIFDTARGIGASIGTTSKALVPHMPDAQLNFSNSVAAPTASGVTVGVDRSNSGRNYAAYTFAKSPRFFDVVTWTGDGAGDREIPHSLGAVPGMVIVKATNQSSDWWVWHRSLAAAEYMKLNTTDMKFASGAPGIIQPNSSSFWVHQYGSHWVHNEVGKQYVAYVFGHDSSADGFIHAGTFTTDGSGNATVSLGWEPQFVLAKAANGTGHWEIYDSARGFPIEPAQLSLAANSSMAEPIGNAKLAVTSTGFRSIANGNLNRTYVFVALRRGPMKQPSSGSQVFSADAFYHSAVGPTTNAVGVVPDVVIGLPTNASSIYKHGVGARILGAQSTLDVADLAATSTYWSNFLDSSTLAPKAKFDLSNAGNYVSHSFRRFPGVFDVVAFSGNGSPRSISHGLKAVPELIITKRVDGAGNWVTYTPGQSANELMLMNATGARYADPAYYPAAPTSTSFSVGSGVDINAAGGTYLSLLFSTLPGISKVGIYAGSSSDVSVDAGFSGAPRYLLIKRLNDVGNWTVFDATRGIVNGGNDPIKYLNSRTSEVAGTNAIEPTGSGFIVKTGNTSINAAGGSFMFLAIR